MYEVSEVKYDGSARYMMVRISRKDALALIMSLARQLEQGNPNSGREEARYRTVDGKKEGFFSVAVQDDLICPLCHKEYLPFTGVSLLSDTVCKPCAKKVGKATGTQIRGVDF